MKKKNMPLFDSSDPRSLDYIRILHKPIIDWKKTIIRSLVPIIVGVLCFFVLSMIGLSDAISILLIIIGLLVYSIVSLKETIIEAVSIYQAIAPEKIRRKCRFEPSCSQYMILAVEKYGALKGLLKGLRRLSKCNSRGNGLGGGIDYP